MMQFSEMECKECHPIVIAAYLHLELVRIHPFTDRNGRTARLLMNLYLLRKGLVILNLKGEQQDKLRYYQSLERSHTEGGSDEFYRLIAEAEAAALDRYLQLIP